ncbi:MAG: undecaprenyldiphospho-muramoylpentapeptide beta-N-acetylglucosaminyltransferase [Succinivibrio sp.]
MLKKVLIMAGGTGGHVFPAIAIAQKLKEQGCQILWLGTRGRMEEQLVPKHGFDIRYIDVKGVRRNGIKTKLKAPFMVFHAVLQALSVIKEFKPDVVLGMGGYASGPGGVAAFIKRIPLILHEQNAAAGMTNKLLFRLARKVLLGFPGAFTGKKVTIVGNPVRESILKVHEKRNAQTPDAPVRISIVGGSLGARALNELVPDALKNFSSSQIEVVHQCGKGNSEKVKALYNGSAFRYQVSDFVDDMDDLYSKTDLMICRAGALTVAEVTCAGIPALFVPLPTAVDDHQTKNAMTVAQKGGAQVLKQSELTSEKLSEIVESLLSDRQRLLSMAKASFSCATANATDDAVQIIKDTVK